MISALIVDDEQKNTEMLAALLRTYCPQVTVAGVAASAAEGKEQIEKLQPQLIFLDIEMPYGSGFDLLRSIPEITAQVIFVTAFDQYALIAFRYAAVDYLLKPVNIEQLQEAVARAEQLINSKVLENNYKLLLSNLDEKDTTLQEIALNDKGSQYRVRFADIKYIIADGSYTHIHTVSRVFVTTKNLKDYEDILPAEVFCRIHHGHIVNTHHIEKVKKGRGGTVFMSDKMPLEVAVRRKDHFMKVFKNCSERKK
jgi:two-component system LytT family response regulator